jgi:hypothetical protein
MAQVIIDANFVVVVRDEVVSMAHTHMTLCLSGLDRLYFKDLMQDDRQAVMPFGGTLAGCHGWWRL